MSHFYIPSVIIIVVTFEGIRLYHQAIYIITKIFKLNSTKQPKEIHTVQILLKYKILILVSMSNCIKECDKLITMGKGKNTGCSDTLAQPAQL